MVSMSSSSFITVIYEPQSTSLTFAGSLSMTALHIGIDLVLLFCLLEVGVLVDDEKYLFIKRFQVVHHLKESAEADIRQSEPLRNAPVNQFQIALKGVCHAHMVDDDTLKALCSFAQKRGFSDSALAVEQHCRPVFP